MTFASLARSAKAWLGAPDEGKLAALLARSQDLAPVVPEARRADWDKLLAGLAKGDEDLARTRARVEGLVRACRLFAKTQAKKKPPPPPLAALDPVDRLPGIGPGARAALAEHGVRSVADLVWTPPSSWDDLRSPIPLADALAAARAAAAAHDGGDARPPRIAVSAVVKSAGVIPMRGRRAVRVVLADPVDPKCTLHAYWFFLAHGVLGLAKPGRAVILVGRIRVVPKSPPRAAHVELHLDTPEARIARARYGRMGPPESVLRRAIAHAAREVAPDPVPAVVASREGMPEVSSLLREVHAVSGDPPADEVKVRLYERLAWAEAFTRAWERVAAEEAAGSAAAPRLPRRRDLEERLERELGFRFTGDQRAAIDAVTSDLEGPRAMRRLLLGDVGTGKTAVALAAAAQCIAEGYQVAILAPTSVLAEQYVDAVAPLTRAVSARAVLCAAGLPAAQRREAEEAAASGAAAVVVGTHALLRDGMELARLGLVVVDEQQRLGVAQRLALVRKGARPHLLTLSATPIPRTLALALRGELATTSLRERPAGRQPVATELASSAAIEAVVDRVIAAAKRGERVFWIVPRVEAVTEDEEGGEGDDDVPLTSAVERHAALEATLGRHGLRAGILHGGMPGDAKRAAMRAFRAGDTDVLVGTTVVEVGVDVPEATLIVVENAERFGLAQLHQLRGRVGRGALPGTCILVHPEPLEGPAQARLGVLTRLSHGEDVARADLELRGAGDLGGTRQHGVEDELLYLLAGAPHPWLPRVEDDARAIRAADPKLAAPEHAVLGSMVARLGHAIAVREDAG